MPAVAWVWELPVAHRGLHDAAGRPENSLPALDAAAEAGLPVEIDVRRTADGAAAVVHDEDLNRLTGRPGRVARTPLQELRHRHLHGTEHTIPALAEALELVAGRVPVLVDVKNNTSRPGPLEEAVLAAFRRSRGDWAATSFNPLTVRWFALRAPGVPRGQTTQGLHVPGLPGWLRPLLDAGAVRPWTRPDFLCHELAALPNPVARAWRRAGRPVVAWTATTPAELSRAREVADNVIFQRVGVEAVAEAGFPVPGR